MQQNTSILGYTHQKKKLQANTSDHQNVEEPDDSNEEPIKLQDKMGYVRQRRKPAIVRSHQWSLKKQPEEYYHAQLLLYFPWRIEPQHQITTTYQDSFIENYDVIKENRSYYEQHADEVSQAVENLEQVHDLDEVWQTLAPQTLQERAEDEQQLLSVESVMNAFEPTHNRTVSTDLGLPAFEIEFTTEKMSNSEWYEHINSLNQTQSELHQFVVDWC